MARLRVTGWDLARGATLGVAVALVTTAGCGDEPASTAPAEEARPAVVPSSVPDDAYELDVIAEAEPDEGAPPLTVQFRGYVEEDEGGPWRFAWDFGDGTTSAEQDPTHTYGVAGDYTATLTATDRAGHMGTDEIDVFVDADD